MKQNKIAYSLLLALAAPLFAAEPDAAARLERALQAGANFQYGGESAPLREAEQLVIESAQEPQRRAAAEARLIQALASSSTREFKQFVCRQLFVIGTARAVPALESLLTDPALSHPARYALGRMEAPEAGAALRRGLSGTTGNQQAGLINTLGARRDQAAVPEIVKLLSSPDPEVAGAAIAALGQIGGDHAVQALEQTAAQASGARKNELDAALLVGADRSLAAGQNAEAARLYESLYGPDHPRRLRIAALRGLIESRGPAAADLLEQAIRGADAGVQASAIGFARAVPGEAVTRRLSSLLPALGPEAQGLLVRVMGERGDAAAVPGVLAATTSETEAARMAAWEALGNLGDAAAVTPLARAAARASGNEQRAARASLLRLKGVDDAMLEAVRANEPKIRLELIRALAGRKARSALPALFDLARADDQAVRQEALRALGVLAGEAELPALVKVAAQPRDAADRPAAEEAIASAFRRVADPERRAAPVLAALTGAPVEARAVLVRLLSLAATRRGLEEVRAALKDQAAVVREAAARSLAEWPDATPAEDLLALAGSVPDQTLKVLALRGYVRMAGLTDNPTAMYLRAMALAQRADDKKLVLGGLGTASSIEALQLAQKYLGDEALQAEAGLAVVQIAGRLRQTDAGRAKAVVKQVLASVKEPRIRRQAQELVNELEQFDGYLLAWQIAGPYKEKGKESREVFDIVFPAEQAIASAVSWKPLKTGIGPWDINLAAALGGEDHAAAYVRTRIWSPADREARLELGSDDAIKAWLNGKLAHANYTNRGLAPRQDVAPVKLKEGWNDLLLKVVNHAGPWAFCARLRAADGSAIEELKVQTP